MPRPPAETARRLIAGLALAALVVPALPAGSAHSAPASHSAPAALAASAAQAAPAALGGDQLDLPGTQVRVEPGATISSLPPVTTSSFVIADAETGEILAAKNAHQRLRPASTLKTLTAVTLLPRLDPDDTYVPVYEDISAEGSKVGIVNGSTYTIDQLWYGLFLSSGNDTAHALARANGGMRPTVAQMNEEARRLQANDTVAKNPSGLDADGQYSSAYDLALISRAGLAMPDFAHYCSTLSVKFPREGTKAKRKTFMVYNHNPLLLGGYKGAVGVKTGYTSLAGRTFVGAAERGDRTLIVTLMNYGGSTYRTSADLLTWGFKNADKLEPVGTLVDPLPDATAENADASSTDEPRTSTAGAGGSGGVPLWPFLLVGIPLLLLAVGAMTGRLPTRPRDPLAAANKGLGKPGKAGTGYGSGPRGRNGLGRY